eukprot:Sdes_comp19282_c0_seq4m10316
MRAKNLYISAAGFLLGFIATSWWFYSAAKDYEEEEEEPETEAQTILQPVETIHVPRSIRPPKPFPVERPGLRLSLSGEIIANEENSPAENLFLVLKIDTLAMLRKMCDSFDVFLVVQIKQMEEQCVWLKCLSAAGFFNQCLDERKVVFCTSSEGKSHIVRHIEPQIHIDGSFFPHLFQFLNLS